jgi:copper(I)-binding protein
MKPVYLAAVCLFAALAGRPALAKDIHLGDLVFTHPKAYRAGGAPDDMIGVLGIRCNNLAGDTLTGVSVEKSVARKAEIQRVDIHDGVRKVVPLASLFIEPGDAVELRPGRVRLAFIGVTRLEPGTALEVELTFRKAGAIVIAFEVEGAPPPARGFKAGGAEIEDAPRSDRALETRP